MLNDVCSQWRGFGFHVKGLIDVLFLDSCASFTPTFSALPPCVTCSMFMGVKPRYSAAHSSPPSAEHQGMRLWCWRCSRRVLQADTNFVVVKALILVDLFKALRTVSFCLLYILFILELLKTQHKGRTMTRLGLANVTKNYQSYVLKDTLSDLIVH